MSPSDRPSARVDTDHAQTALDQGTGAIKGADSLRGSLAPSRRVGRTDLVRIRQQLSERDIAVLQSVRAFRLIQIHQLKRLHFADHASEGAGKRVCRSVLERLHKRDLVHRLERRIGGFRAGSAGHVYSLSPLGHRLLGANKRRRRSEPTTGFMRHTLAIAEIATSLKTTVGDQAIELMELEPEPYCWRYPQGAVRQSAATATLKPDLFVVVANADYELNWFVEIDCGTESANTIAKKCRAYTAYWRTGAEQQKREVFPKVLWSAPDQKRAEQIGRAIHADGIEPALFAVAIFEHAVTALTNFGVGAP